MQRTLDPKVVADFWNRHYDKGQPDITHAFGTSPYYAAAHETVETYLANLLKPRTQYTSIQDEGAFLLACAHKAGVTVPASGLYLQESRADNVHHLLCLAAHEGKAGALINVLNRELAVPECDQKLQILTRWAAEQVPLEAVLGDTGIAAIKNRMPVLKSGIPLQ